MVTLLNQHDPLRRWKSDDMARVQRLGKKERETNRERSGSGRPRPVLVRFVRGSNKRRLISSRTLRKELYKANVTMNDDLTAKQRDTLKQLRDDGWAAYCRGTRLITTRRQQVRPGRPDVNDAAFAGGQARRLAAGGLAGTLAGPGSSRSPLLTTARQGGGRAAMLRPEQPAAPPFTGQTRSSPRLWPWPWFTGQSAGRHRS